jgi:hypothetical protein
MKFYSLEDKFGFGKYSENTLNEILQQDKTYFEWCLINLNHFLIDDDVIDEIQSGNPSFQISTEAERARVSKLEEYYEEQVSFGDDDFDYPEEDYGSSGEKYGWYNGFSDDAIDDAFEGDPMNTWNVD